MKESRREPEEEWDVNDWLERNFGTINDERVLIGIRDHRLGPEEEGTRNIETERKWHSIVTLWFEVDGLSSDRREQQGKWERHLYVFHGVIQHEPAKKMAAELKCSPSTIYRLWKEIRFVISMFSVLILELEDRLTDRMAQRVLHRIRIGWERKQIIRQFEEDAEVVDRAYVILRTTFLKILEEFQDMSQQNPEKILWLFEVKRQIEN